MIVEDEPIVLEGMLKIINFSDLGFEVVAACSNGKEAYENFYTTKPDVVITDICMEIMDGLEFIESVIHDSPDTKFIIISGHQDFKFFKMALNLRVSDYILKPVTAKEFRELLTKTAGELDARKLKNAEIEEKAKSSDEPLQLQKNFFLNEIVNLELAENEILANLDKYNIDLSNNSYQVLIFEMQDLPAANKLLNYSSSSHLLRDIKTEINKLAADYKNTVTFINPQGQVITIINNDNYEYIMNLTQMIAQSMFKRFGNNECTLINCYAGYYVDSLLNISRSYKSANKMNSYGVFSNETGFYDANIILVKRNEKSYNHSDDMNQWIRNIIYAETQAVIVLEDIIKSIKNAGYLLNDYRTIALKMTESLSKELDLTDTNYVNVDINLEAFSENEITYYLYDLTKTGIEKISQANNVKEVYIADKAIQFIQENFSDTHLGLQQICDYLNISVSYFSSIFKAHTEMTFIKYLNNYRTEKAKYFLEFSQKTISEISEMAGYIEPHYFGVVFKKYTGQTPRKYRAMMRKTI